MSANIPATVPYRLPAAAIWRAFLAAGKKHLLITGSIGSGKSTLLRDLVTTASGSCSHTATVSVCSSQAPHKTPFLTDTQTCPLPYLRSFVNRTEKPQVFLEYLGERAPIGKYIEAAGSMQPCEEGFLRLGLKALSDMKTSAAPYCFIDELGYLETACKPFQQAVSSLMNSRSCIIVVRKQDTPFLKTLRSRPDVFLYDLNAPLPDIGLIIMASGDSKRFGSNKLLYPYQGHPLINCILSATAMPWLQRIVVTRHPEIVTLCQAENIPVLLHDRPYRNHTVLLGTTTLKEAHPHLTGYMYASSDQPFLTAETITSLSLVLHSHPDSIIRPAYQETPGNPIVFGACYYDELITLPDKKGGSFVAGKYPEKNIFLPVANRKELTDIDTPADLDKLSHP